MQIFTLLGDFANLWFLFVHDALSIITHYPRKVFPLLHHENEEVFQSAFMLYSISI